MKDTTKANLLIKMGIKVSIEDYFKYHPPTTEIRKKAHEKINAGALSLAKTLIETCIKIDDLKFSDLTQKLEKHSLLLFGEKALIDYMLTIKDLVKDETCLSYCFKAGEQLKHAINYAYADEDNLKTRVTETLMTIQQIRMFGNQGVTIDDISTYPSCDEKL